jgi:hypothetical protein
MSQDLVPTALPAAFMSAARQPKTSVAPVDHALKAFALQGGHTARLAGAAVGTAQLLARGLDDDAWEELWLMQGEVRRRMTRLQQEIIGDWFAWGRYADQIGGANTMSKLAEREYNTLAQATQLVGAHTTSFMALLENIQVGYLYWLREKTAPAADS